MHTNAVSHAAKYQTLQLFRMEDITMSLDDRVASATGVIMDLFEEGRPIVVACSFGKDSSAVMSIVMNAARDFAAAGGKPLVVATSADTLVENPEVHAMAKKEMSKLHAYAKEHGIRFFGKFVTPPLLSTFQVKILSGRAERDQSQAVFDSMTEGFGLVDADWTVLRMNDAGLRLGHRTIAEVVGRNHWDIWPEAVGTEVEQLYRKVMETGVPGTLEYAQLFGNVKVTWFEIRAYRTSSMGLAIFYRDIAERKIAERKLTETDRQKDEFLAMLAHELRNPLAPISAAAAVLSLGRPDEARVRKTSEIISRQVRHMSSLLDDLLDVARVTRGLIELNHATLDAKSILSSAIEQVRPLIEKRGHSLVLHVPPEPAFIHGDEERLIQVMANLLNNAAKYTPEGGQITARISVNQDSVTSTGCDTGIGMAPALLARAFELFAQESRTSDRSQGGLGLGLALVKSLVELHGGSVSAVSEGLEKGSQFSVALPRVEPDSAPDSAAFANTHDHGVAPLKMLVVDDNIDAANSLAMLLESIGHNVFVEYCAADALVRARAETPDVCLLDIGLPDMDGNQLAQEILAQPEMTTAIMIAVTGYGQYDDIRVSKAAGFVHHLVKPVESGRLCALIAQIGNDKAD